MPLSPLVPFLTAPHLGIVLCLCSLLFLKFGFYCLYRAVSSLLPQVVTLVQFYILVYLPFYESHNTHPSVPSLLLNNFRIPFQISPILPAFPTLNLLPHFFHTPFILIFFIFSHSFHTPFKLTSFKLTSFKLASFKFTSFNFFSTHLQLFVHYNTFHSLNKGSYFATISLYLPTTQNYLVIPILLKIHYKTSPQFTLNTQVQFFT